MRSGSLTGILVGPKVLSVASQTVLLHILGSRGSHIFMQIDHEIIYKVILTPSAAQLQTFKNMTFFKMSKYDIRPDFECQSTIFGLSSIAKYDFECQNTIFGWISKFKIGF